MEKHERKTEKRPWSHNIDVEIIEEFKQLAAKTRGHEYEIIEAMIRAFNALPEDLRVKLMSVDPEKRAPVLAFLASLALPPTSGKSGRKTKSV